MSYSGDIALSNTFELLIRNSSSTFQPIQAFELGSSNPNRILTDPVFQSVPNQANMIWDLSSGTPFERKTIGGTEQLIYRSSQVDIDIVINGGTSSTQLLVTAGITLDRLNERLNLALKSAPFTKYFRIFFSPRVVDGRMLDDEIIVSLVYFPYNPDNGVVEAGFFTGDPNDNTNTKLAFDLAFNNQVPLATYPNQNLGGLNNLQSESVNVSVNGAISLPEVAGVPYSEILESQNGQVLDIKSMRIDAIGSNGDGTNTQADTISQLLEPLKFIKKDINGNDLEYNKIPVIDPYQFQNTIDYIDMRTKADTFALDGNTGFETRIAPNTTLRLTCAYTQLTNFTAGSQIAKEEEQRLEDKIEGKRAESDFRRTYKLQVPEQVIKDIEDENTRLDNLEKKKHYKNHSLLLQSFLWSQDCSLLQTNY